MKENKNDASAKAPKEREEKFFFFQRSSGRNWRGMRGVKGLTIIGTTTINVGRTRKLAEAKSEKKSKVNRRRCVKNIEKGEENWRKYFLASHCADKYGVRERERRKNRRCDGRNGGDKKKNYLLLFFSSLQSFDFMLSISLVFFTKWKSQKDIIGD